MAGPATTTLLYPNPADGNLTADGSQNCIAGGSASGTYLPKVNLTNMADGDITELAGFGRAYSGDGVVTAESYGSGTGSQTTFLHALGGGLTGMTLNQTGVTSSTTGNITIATPPSGIPVAGQFYIANITRGEWAVASYVSATSINLVTRGVLGTTAAAWTNGDALTIANQPVQPGSVAITAPSAVVTTETPGFGNPNTSGAPNGLSGVFSGSGISSGIIEYATGACVVTFSSAPANGSNNITAAYTALYQIFRNTLGGPAASSDKLPPQGAIPTEGAILFALRQLAGTNRSYRVGVLNLNGT